MAVDLINFPKTIQQLKGGWEAAGSPRKLWARFEDFFSSHGLELWVESDPPPGFAVSFVVPPDDRPRQLDGFSYRIPDVPDAPQRYPHRNGTHCPARTVDGQDVMIRVVSIGSDGTNQREALLRLATGTITSAVGNPCVPVLRWLVFEDIHFAVQPFLSFIGLSQQFIFETLDNLLEVLRHMLEALQFCHDRRVAHLDVFYENWLVNLYGGPLLDDQPQQGSEKPEPTALRTIPHFKIYLNDFECAACFDPGSDPETHLLSGMPIINYGRTIPREMRLGLPYNPFPVDIWHLAGIIQQTQGFKRVPDSFREFVRRMRSYYADERPTAAEALADLAALRSQYDAADLSASLYD
ncbi:hypothetical protein EXIGLDRAFT_719873 [Exidia glandulosa HHB12029]|uniref:Protein kinase domain-containing protein n=1 Tax=Exidia glandulosa HHB12029 TaxID=1314781 RepID=A0A165GQ06_EXIGL|nr:hypothetical protein EXIGLDRAFT_719873 [Exidia glandulosa HHB12029]